LNGLLVDFHCGLDDDFASAHKRRIEALAEMPIAYGREDFDHRVVAKRVHGDHVQMTRESAGYVVASTARRTHRSQKYLLFFHLL
jgi:hypothetical protein